MPDVREGTCSASGPATDLGWPPTGTEIDGVLARKPSLKHMPALRVQAAFTAYGKGVRFERVKPAPIAAAGRIHAARGATASSAAGVSDVS